MAQLKSTTVTGNLAVTGKVLASAIMKMGGTRDEILCADGSTTTLSGLGAGTVTSVTVQGSSGLTGSGTVTSAGTITLSHGNTSDATNLTANGRTYVTGLTFDDYGHVTGYTTGTETVTAPDVSGFLKTNGTNTMNATLQFNAAHPIYWSGGSYHQRIYVTDDDSKNTAVFTFQQTENSGTSWNDLFTIQDRGSVIMKNPEGTATSLVFDRTNNANWKLLSDNGDFIMQCDYTSKKDSYYDVLRLKYNSKNAIFSNTVESKGFIGTFTPATNLTKADYVVMADGTFKTISAVGGAYLPLAGGEMTGPIDFEDKANASGKNKNYISAGGGYGTTSGKEGLKILALNQDNARMGLGVDLTGGSYELTVATGRADDNTASKIGFATHTTGATAYKTLGYFTASGAADPEVVFNVNGTIQENGTALSSKYVATVTSTDNAVVRFNGTQGAVQNSGVTIDDSNNLKIGSSYSSTTANNPYLSFGGEAKISANSNGALGLGPDNKYVYLIEEASLRMFSDFKGKPTLGKAGYAWKSLYLTESIVKETYNSSGTTTATHTYTLPNSTGTLATQEWVNEQGFGGEVDLDKYVTLGTKQRISGQKLFTSNDSAGSTTIASGLDAIKLSPYNRTGTIGEYYPGIAFNNLEFWSNNTYVGGAQAWIGTRLVDKTGSEQVDLVFATKEDNSSGPKRPIERMCVRYNGNVGIGTQTPSVPLEVNGALKATTVNVNGQATFQYNSSTDCVELVW